MRFIPIVTSEKSDEGLLLIFSDVTDKKKYEHELVHKATVDYLTGLYNRMHFLDEFYKQCSGYKGCISLLLLDIDSFKTINDTYGHQAGDEVLIKFSEKLQEYFDSRGIVGRIGGEEFTVYLKGKSCQDTMALAERFREEIEVTPFPLKSGQKITVKVSIGVSFSLKGAVSFEIFHKYADAALYLAKNSGKNQVRSYEIGESINWDKSNVVARN